MILSGGALNKGRVACGCIFFLGFTTGTGLTCTEINSSGVSTAFGVIGGWFSEIFKSEGPASPPLEPAIPLDPIAPIAQGWGKLSEWTTTVVGAVPVGYQWIKESENSEFLLTFFKSFWNFSFAKNVVFNLHLTIRAWLGVIFDSDVLSKIPDAFKTFKVLAKFLSKTDASQNGDKDMINWLYLRFMVNPRRTINVLKRGSKNVSDENSLKCNGKGKGRKQGTNLPLGVCFVCEDGKKLIEHMNKFLKEGIIPPITPKKAE